jgi:hypothetical protein
MQRPCGKIPQGKKNPRVIMKTLPFLAKYFKIGKMQRPRGKKTLGCSRPGGKQKSTKNTYKVLPKSNLKK